jgi:hypothetical protein
VTDWTTIERRVGVSLIALALGAGIGLGARKLADRGDHAKATPAATSVGRAPAPLAAGRYNSQRFTLVRYFTVGAGWRLDVDRVSILEISRQTAPLGSIGFDQPLEVFEDGFLPPDQALGAAAKVQPLPADLGAFFRSRPEVDTSASQPTAVDGVPGETFIVRLKPLPGDNVHLCGPTRCIFYARNGRQLFALFENDATEFTVLRLKKQALVIAVAAPGPKFEDFRPLAHKVLATVRLHQR